MYGTSPAAAGPAVLAPCALARGHECVQIGVGEAEVAADPGVRDGPFRCLLAQPGSGDLEELGGLVGGVQTDTWGSGSATVSEMVFLAQDRRVSDCTLVDCAGT